jgi:hypothetical protein
MAVRSLDLVHAWIVAAPFSFDAFASTPHLLALERSNAGLAGATHALWTLTEEALRPRLDGVSLATLEHLRDRAWFCDPEARALARSTPLVDYLAHVAAQWIDHNGGHPVLAEPTSLAVGASDRIAQWRWMSLVLPADLIVAAACIGGDNGTAPLDDHPSLASRLLARLVHDEPATTQAGVAETHVHGNAALSFGDLWGNWLASASDEPSASAARMAAPAPFETVGRLRSIALCAVLTREAMGRFLEEPDWARAQGFDPWFEATACGALRDGVAIARDVYGVEPWNVAAVWRQSFASLRAGELDCDEEQALRRRLLWRAVQRDGSVFERRTAGRRVSDETILTQRALRYLRYRRDDAPFAQLFWQYVRLRVALFRTITLEPGTPGLDWFNRTDRRVALFRHGRFRADRLAQGIANASAGVALRAYEARFVPEETVGELRRSCVEMIEGALVAREGSRSRHEWSRWEFGLVYHFAKSDRSERSPREEASAPALLADPSCSDGLAYGEWIAQNTRRAEALSALLDGSSEALLVVRGVDVAGRELSMPTWPTTSMLRAVRDASCRAAREARQRWPALGLQELRCTYHCGEDYRHLTEGLRRVHEVFEAGLVRRGDRLGHAIALGEPPQRRARESRPAITTRLDRLHDLLWELDRYAEGAFRPPPGRVERAEEESRTHIAALFAAPSKLSIDLREHRDARRWLLVPRVQRQLGYAIARDIDEQDLPNITPRGWSILRAYAESATLFERSLEPVTVAFDEAEYEMLELAQRWLRRVVTEREITVEANPSSNLLIADYGAIEEHPVFRLLPLQSRRTETPVLVSLSSDDPIVFATRLGDEYAYVFDALRSRGVSAPEALEWLDRVRENAIRSRFTLPPSSDDEALRWLLVRLREGATDETERVERAWARGDRCWNTTTAR